METERFYEIRLIMEKAFSDGEIISAEKLAIEYLEIANIKKGNWNYGNAIHHANLILGRIALKNGDTLSAKKYLIKAGNTPGSPQLNSFGPNMLLAKELLEKGEKKSVIEYLNLTKKFWKLFFSWRKVRKWKKEIMKDKICLLYTSPSPRDATLSRMPSSA